jgi:molybdopterin molybdotransferase
LAKSGNNVSESSLSAKRKSSAHATVAEARAAMLAGIAVTSEESVTLGEALGRVLARPVSAKRDQPPFAVSEMDGYAVIAASTPASLNLIGESSAGHGFAGRLTPGSAVRISTGAAVPQGADAVVIQENVSRTGDLVQVPRAEKGQHIRPQAMDFTAGTILLKAGRKLDGIALALASASGMAKLSVRRRPRVAILSGGDELADPGATPGPFQIFDSGTYGIAAQIAAWGGEPHRLQLEKDDVAAIARAAENGLKDNDMLVLVGGASVGDHDHARPALQKLGLQMMVNKVNLRPGKPTWFGHALQRPVLGLPGNPASALVCAHLFLKPLLETMLGRDADVTSRRARLLEALPANGGREHYLRAHLAIDVDGALSVRAFEQQDSSLLSVFAAANALIRLPPGAPAQAEGVLVDVLPLDSF